MKELDNIKIIGPKVGGGNSGGGGGTQGVTRQQLENGTVIPAYAGNLSSWASRKALSVSDTWSAVARTTAGENSIDSSVAAKIVSIVPSSDFSATALSATGFNLLHSATAVGSGFYILVPAMSFGSYGTAAQPNGILFTARNGSNLSPTVYFKPYADGVPTSETDGTALTPHVENGYSFYTTSGTGYMIVSGITIADTCAHVAWSRRYDEFIAYDEATDAGSTIQLSSLLSALHQDVSKMLAVGSGGSLVADRLDFGDSSAQWTRNVQRTEPSWTTTADPVEEGATQTYTHSAAISGMKSNGIAEFETSGPALSVTGTTVSYQDENETAQSGYVKYQLATPATGTVTISPSYAVEDWGLEYLSGATGAAFVTTQYAQNYPDALAALLSSIDNNTVPIIAEAFASMNARISELEAALYDAGTRISMTAKSVDSEEFSKYGFPTVLESATGGAPSAAVVPDNWDQDTMGVWNGTPRFLGQRYIDKVNRKVYEATTLTDSTSDWSVLN